MLCWVLKSRRTCKSSLNILSFTECGRVIKNLRNVYEGQKLWKLVNKNCFTGQGCTYFSIQLNGKSVAIHVACFTRFLSKLIYEFTVICGFSFYKVSFFPDFWKTTFHFINVTYRKLFKNYFRFKHSQIHISLIKICCHKLQFEQPLTTVPPLVYVN